MALHLITGYAGTEHITSADQGAYNMGTFGEGEFVLDRGNKLGATVVTNNSITIADGEALMQGRFIKIPVGTSENAAIDNGTSGMKRKDLIVLRYSKDAGTGIESVALAVKKGTPSSGTPSDPSVTTGNITDGTDLVNEMKLYRVNIDGLNIVSIDTLFSVKTTMVEYMDEYQLPVADANTLGGVKIGANITRASDGTISIPDGTTSAKGIVQIGDHLKIKDNKIAVKDLIYKNSQLATIEENTTIPARSTKLATFKSQTALNGIKRKIIFATRYPWEGPSVAFILRRFWLDTDGYLYVEGLIINMGDSATSYNKNNTAWLEYDYLAV